MKNSFIIKNADPSFESYYRQMAKRKITINNSTQFGNGGGMLTGFNNMTSIMSNGNNNLD
jgi:hypothetical protein